MDYKDLNLGGVKIYCHSYLPPGTILVSPDLWEVIKKNVSFDEQFLKSLGIENK